MSSKKRTSNGAAEKVAEIKEDAQQQQDNDDGDEDEIDEDQLDEFRGMVEQLGNFPDKVKISSISMVAEDFSESEKEARTLYNVIRDRLMKATREKLLPLVYLVDSIVKNAKGHFIKIVEDDAANWLPHVHQQLQESQKLKLQRVWKMWGDSNLFDEQQLKIMGRCFDKSTNKSVNNTSSSTEVAGISRTGDGTLILPKALRQEMQNILDDMQSDVKEVDKISLERLAQINPSLLAKVKKTALEGLGTAVGGRTGNATGNGNAKSLSGANKHHDSLAPLDNPDLPSFMTDTRSSIQIKRAKAWMDIADKTMEGAPSLVQEIASLVEHCGDSQYTQPEALAMTQYFAAASAAGRLLDLTIKRIKTERDEKRNAILMTANLAASHIAGLTQAQDVDPNDFTNDGIKKKNTSAISMLYEVGLPFVSSADGRRFRTQLELSKHLDSLFKRNQLEKSIAKTEERGWYDPDIVWTGEAKRQDLVLRQEDDPAAAAALQTAMDAGDGYSPETSTMPADEVHQQCVICGINFKMFFDDDGGIYLYRNCREIELVNDDIALYDDSKPMLVHINCWRGLGSPKELHRDQVLHDAVH